MVTSSSTTPPKIVVEVTKEKEVVIASWTVQNVNYDALSQDALLFDEFLLTIRVAVAETAGPHVDPEHVTVVLSAGSVYVEATIAPPDVVSIKNLKDSMAHSTDSLAESIITGIAALTGIGAVQTGQIGVTGMKVVSQKRGAEPAPYASGATAGGGPSPGVSSTVSVAIRALPAVVLSFRLLLPNSWP